MTRHRPPRLAPTHYAGKVRCFFTICALHRRNIFVDSVPTRLAIAQIPPLAEAFDVCATAWCLMPDHAHFLTEGRSDRSDALAFVCRWKQRVAFARRHEYGRTIWQEGFFDRVLREEDDDRRVAAYVLANPVRAGLATRLGEYPYAGSDLYAPAMLADLFEEAVHGRCWTRWQA
jgi:REP element-mobilizing transposase RayT